MTKKKSPSYRLVGALGAAGGVMVFCPLLIYLLEPQDWHWYGVAPLIIDWVIGIFLIGLALVIRKDAIRKGEYNKKVVSAALLIFCIALATFLPATTFLPAQAATTAPLTVYKSSDGNLVIETDKLMVIVENSSQTYGRLLCIENGTQTVFEITVANNSEVLSVNGTVALKIPVEGNSSLVTVSNGSATNESDPYLWDTIHFVGATGGQNPIYYPHPDRDYYNINPRNYWTQAGTLLYHNQIDQSDSGILKDAGFPAIGAAIGVLIGDLIGDGEGAVIGAIVGVIIGAVLAWKVAGPFLDELGCIWWWTSQAYVKWLTDNALWLYLLYETFPAAASVAAMKDFLDCGYLRVGPTTFYDGIGVGDPAPPPNFSTGGEDVPIDKVSLITPYVALTLIACVVFIVSSRKFGKRRN